jgi:two-component system NtrC family sensor kinase
VIDLPAAAEEATASAPAAAEKPEASLAAAAGRLLVVDDETVISDLVRDVLVPLGWAVDAAHDGREALEILAEREFDVLLVDMRMPGMDGRTLYEALRAARPGFAERVVFATGDTGNDSTSDFLEETGNLVLRKPYELRALIDTVSAVAARATRAS